jgi:hypothetical protein
MGCEKAALFSSLQDISSRWKTFEQEGIFDFLKINSETSIPGIERPEGRENISRILI